MSETIDQQESTPPQARRNWWKLAFFIMLFVFESIREVAVLGFAQGAIPNSKATLFNLDGYAHAKGTWRRIDGGEPLGQTAVSIECRRETGQCLEALTRMDEQYVYAPQLDWFDAEFSSQSISYENDRPDCARYSVRLDLRMSKVFAVRDRKENPSNPNCSMMERRIEMQLSDGYEPNCDAVKGHFLPILRIINALSGS